jgi:hypothetical protein
VIWNRLKPWGEYPRQLGCHGDTLIENEAVIYQPSRLPDVFRDKLEKDFEAVEQAIDDRPSMYDDDARNEDDESVGDF